MSPTHFAGARLSERGWKEKIPGQGQPNDRAHTHQSVKAVAVGEGRIERRSFPQGLPQRLDPFRSQKLLHRRRKRLLPALNEKRLALDLLVLRLLRPPNQPQSVRPCGSHHPLGFHWEAFLRDKWSGARRTSIEMRRRPHPPLVCAGPESPILPTNANACLGKSYPKNDQSPQLTLPQTTELRPARPSDRGSDLLPLERAPAPSYAPEPTLARKRTGEIAKKFRKWDKN